MYSPSGKTKFTLLLCTMNRPDLVGDCLKSLHAQTYSNYEIIIVDQSDFPYTPITGDKICYVHIDEKGLSNARNVGLEYASGEYCCLIDDDAYYEPNWLTKVNNSIKKLPKDVICGRIRDPQTNEYALHGRNEKPIDNLKYSDIQKYGLSACCVFLTHTLKTIRFDDEFGVGRHWGAGEETDAIWSIMEQNGSVKYDPNLVVIHPVSNDKRLLKYEKIISYNLGFGAMFAKHILLGNQIIRLIYFYSLVRNTAGMILNLIHNDKQLFNIQKVVFKAKITGFREYMDKYHK